MPLPLTVSCSSISVPAHLGSRRQRVVKRALLLLFNNNCKKNLAVVNMVLRFIDSICSVTNSAVSYNTTKFAVAKQLTL